MHAGAEYGTRKTAHARQNVDDFCKRLGLTKLIFYQPQPTSKACYQRVCLVAPLLPTISNSQFILVPMQGGSRLQRPNDLDDLNSALSTAIEGFNLAKEVMNIAPAKAAFGSVSIILAMVRVRCGYPQSLS